jgi:predicted aconitase/predicted aconitase with swiveling domain
VPTTLNAAGCDEAQFAAMHITAPDFLEHNHEIVSLYTQMGVLPIQSCVPYEWEGVITEGTAAWAESNAICFGNSYCGLHTNRESGLSALASALTGYTPAYGLLEPEGRRPNLRVTVTAQMRDPTDYSLLGDWIGGQRRREWIMPLGPIPVIEGLPDELSHEEKKALSAAAANYGCALLYLGESAVEPVFQTRLIFDEAVLQGRYEELRPRRPVSLIAIGCPQASLGELRAVAELLRGKKVRAEPAAGGETPPLWVFTSAATRVIAEKTGLAAVIRGAGALLLENTCPEVVPYDPAWVSHVLTNSMKAEHYIKSGLNGIPTSVMRLSECIAVATGERTIAQESIPEKIREWQVPRHRGEKHGRGNAPPVAATPDIGPFVAEGLGLPSQGDFAIRGEAFVSEAPITFLGYVNRKTGVVEEPGHPRDGQSMAGKVAIFPKGSGSSVAPYVLLELYYRGLSPLAMINTTIDQQTAPACSLESIPYAYGFDADVISGVNHGDLVEVRRQGSRVILRVLKRRTD